MARLMAGLMLLAIFSFSTLFYQQFYIPKLLVFYGMAVVGLALIAARQQLRLPSTKTLLFMACFILTGALQGWTSTAPLTSVMQLAFFLGACLLYLAFLQFDHSDLEKLLQVLFVASLLQLALIVPQQLSWHGVLPAALIGTQDRLFGTIGNQEFLSTLLGVGFFIGLHFRDRSSDKQSRVLLLIACSALLLGLVLAKNKGALLFVALYFLWRRYPSYKLLVGLGAMALVLSIFVFPESIKGRVLLWMVAALMYAQHWVTGVGFLQFENHYLDIVRDLFDAHPALAEMFGSHTAMTMDAHNIFLQFGAELGTAGLVLALIFAGHVMRIAKAQRSYLGAALLFLLFKCLYTVVLASITGMIVFVLLLAALSHVRSTELGGMQRYALWTAAPAVASLFIFASALTMSDYYYQQGIRSLFMGQSERAMAELKYALAVNRENPEASLALAQANYLQYDYDAMQLHIQDALRYRKNKDTCKIAASMYFYARRYDEAFVLYEYLHATFPQHLTSLTKLASIDMLRGDFDKAYTMAQLALHALPRKEAESDEKNLRIARQIVRDSYPYLSPAVKPNPGGKP